MGSRKKTKAKILTKVEDETEKDIVETKDLRATIILKRKMTDIAKSKLNMEEK